MTSNIENVVRQLIEEGVNKGNMEIVDARTRSDRVAAAGVPDFRLTIEHWGVPDRLGVLSQLGLLSPPARA